MIAINQSTHKKGKPDREQRPQTHRCGRFPRFLLFARWWSVYSACQYYFLIPNFSALLHFFPVRAAARCTHRSSSCTRVLFFRTVRSRTHTLTHDDTVRSALCALGAFLFADTRWSIYPHDSAPIGRIRSDPGTTTVTLHFRPGFARNPLAVHSSLPTRRRTHSQDASFVFAKLRHFGFLRDPSLATRRLSDLFRGRDRKSVV